MCVVRDISGSRCHGAEGPRRSTWLHGCPTAKLPLRGWMQESPAETLLAAQPRVSPSQRLLVPQDPGSCSSHRWDGLSVEAPCVRPGAPHGAGASELKLLADRRPTLLSSLSPCPRPRCPGMLRLASGLPSAGRLHLGQRPRTDAQGCHAGPWPGLPCPPSLPKPPDRLVLPRPGLPASCTPCAEGFLSCWKDLCSPAIPARGGCVPSDASPMSPDLQGLSLPSA